MTVQVRSSLVRVMDLHTGGSPAAHIRMKAVQTQGSWRTGAGGGVVAGSSQRRVLTHRGAQRGPSSLSAPQPCLGTLGTLNTPPQSKGLESWM